MADSEFVFHADAESEFVAAFQWYWDKNPDTANSFDDAVMAGITLIRRNPSVWPAHIHDTQKFVVRKFPYNIIYKQTADQLIIVAVAHQRRRPGYWNKRI